MSTCLERVRQDEARVSGSFNGDQYMLVEQHTESSIQLLLVELDRCITLIRLIIPLFCSGWFFLNVTTTDAIIIMLT